jgi:hypothetical protein
MKIRISLLHAVGLSVLLASIATAQEQNPMPAQAGAYDLYGTFMVGYRFVSVNPGDQDGAWFQQNANNLFHEQFNLVPSDSSPSIPQMIPLSVNLYGERRAGQSGFFDELFLNADMNPTVVGGSLRLRQFNGYDFKIGFHRTNFFMDRYDSLYTDLRRYDSHRNVLNASLGVTLSDALGISLDYQGIGHGGTINLSRPMYVEGAPEGFTSKPTGRDRIFFTDFRNYYLMQMPRTDWNNNFSGTINATFDRIDIAVGSGYNSFTEDYQVTPVFGSDSLGLNFKDTNNRPTGANKYGIVGDSPARELIRHYVHTEDRKTSGPFFFGQIVTRPVDLLSVTADIRVDKLKMTNDVLTDQILDVRKTSAAKAFQLYRALNSGTIDNDLDRLRASLTATVSPMPDLDITAGWKFDHTKIESTGEYNLHFDTTASTSSGEFSTILPDSVVKSDWTQSNDVPSQTFLGNINFTPMRDLVLNAGVTYMMRKPDTRRLEDGVFDSVYTTNLSKKRTDLGLSFGAAYRVIPELRLRARFELINRKSEFGEDPVAGGPAAGAETDLEPRVLPESVTRVNAGIDWNIVSGLTAGLRFLMSNGSSDLNQSMWVTDGPGGKVELVDKGTTLSAAFIYRLDQNTSFRLTGETRSNEFSIPVTWSRGALLPNPLFPVDPTAPVGSGLIPFDSGTVVLAQKTNDLFIDFGASTRLIDALTIGAGITFMDVTGEPTITSTVKPAANGTIPGPTGEGDVTRVGGPFSRIRINGNLGYDITRQFGVAVDLMYAIQDEKTVIDPAAGERFYGLNDYNGLAVAFNLVFNL